MRLRYGWYVFTTKGGTFAAVANAYGDTPRSFAAVNFRTVRQWLASRATSGSAFSPRAIKLALSAYMLLPTAFGLTVARAAQTRFHGEGQGGVRFLRPPAARRWSQIGNVDV